MRKLAFLLAFAAIPAVAVCGGDSTGPEDISGVYELRTVDGKALPAVLEQTQSFKAEVISMTLSLRQDRTFTLDEHFRFTTASGQVQDEKESSSGAWSRSGQLITLTGGGETDVGRLGKNTITLEILGTVFIFQKK